MNKDRLLKLALATAAFIAVAAVTLAPVKEVKAESASDDSAPAAPAKTEEEYREEARIRQEKLQEEREAQYQTRIDEEVAQFTAQSVPENKTVSVAGSNIKTTCDGLYLAKSVEGIAITTPKENIAASLGVPANDVSVSTWDVNEKKSPAAYNYLKNLIMNGQATYYDEAGNAMIGGGWGNSLIDSNKITLGPAVQINVVAKTKAGAKASNDYMMEDFLGRQYDTVIGMPDDFFVEGARYGYACVVSDERGSSFTGAGEIDPSQIQGNSVHINGTVGSGVYMLFRIE